MDQLIQISSQKPHYFDFNIQPIASIDFRCNFNSRQFTYYIVQVLFALFLALLKFLIRLLVLELLKECIIHVTRAKQRSKILYLFALSLGERMKGVLEVRSISVSLKNSDEFLAIRFPQGDKNFEIDPYFPMYTYDAFLSSQAFF